VHTAQIAKNLDGHLMSKVNTMVKQCAYTVCNLDEPMVPGILPVNWFEDRSLINKQINCSKMARTTKMTDP
jgi:hypothetical protein